MTYIKRIAAVYHMLGFSVLWGKISPAGQKVPGWHRAPPEEPGPLDLVGHLPSEASTPLLVVDCDSAAAAHGWWNGPFKTPLAARTGKGGHFYYRAPEGFWLELARWRMYDDFPDTEVLWKQWCVLPPSPHPLSKDGYEWVGDWGPHTGVFGDLSDLPEAPMEIMSRRLVLSSGPTSLPSEDIARRWANFPNHETRLYDLDSEITQWMYLRPGNRDNQLHVLTSAMVIASETGMFSPEEIKSRLDVLDHVAAQQGGWEDRPATRKFIRAQVGGLSPSVPLREVGSIHSRHSWSPGSRGKPYG